ncbi:MAG: class I SAM-dependent methyltransferase, partial [Prevotella sp.]|nr:class I SAM-dependent methyltransferase [Prevotella sp.]
VISGGHLKCGKVQAYSDVSYGYEVTGEAAISGDVSFYRNNNKADLDSPIADLHLDVTAIDQPSNTYDVVICNHVLEHVSDANKAFKEIQRVLKPGGWAILLVPINPDVDTFEDPTVTDPKERERLYGQYDHVRQFGRDYADVLRKAGFKVVVDRLYYELPEAQRERMRLARRGEECIYRCER